jgi:hypothetical protein
VSTVTLTGEQVAMLLESLKEASPLASLMRYSGRAMYGAECLAIDTEYPEEAVMGVVYDLMADATEATAHLARLLAVKHDVRTDSMGRGTVVYWPTIALPDTFVEDDGLLRCDECDQTLSACDCDGQPAE